MSSVTGHDYVERVREEVATLKDELRSDGIRERIEESSRALGVPEGLGLAAMYRAARRSGVRLDEFLNSLEAAIGSPPLPPNRRP